MLRTRLMKSLWELLGMKSIKEIVAQEPALLERLLVLARRRGSVALTVNDVGDGSKIPAFVNEDARGRRIPGVDLTEGGQTCTIGNVDATLRVGGEMPPNTGKYYVELSIVKCKNFSCIGIGDVGNMHDVSSLLGSEFAKSGFVGWSDDNDCKVNGQWQGHSYLEPVANPSTGFKAGDKVGIELDTDNGTLSWTKNGRLYVKYSRPVEKRAKYFMVSANNTSDLEVSVNVPASYAPVRIGAGSGSISDGGWVTMDMLIAKTQALCVREGTVSEDLALQNTDAVSTTTSTEKAVQGQHALRRSAQASIPGVHAWLTTSQHKVRSKLLHSSVDMAEDSELIPRAPWRLSPWRTHGSSAEVWRRTEEQLAISYARLCVLDLLAARHVAMCKLVDYKSLQDVVSPYFPKGVTGPARRFFRSGPYAQLSLVLDQAMVGWITTMQETTPERVPGQLVSLSKECQVVLQAELYEQYLLAPDGFARYCAAPSVVTWYPRRRMVVGGRWSKVESELGQGATLSMVSWMCRHLCQGYGLRSSGADGGREAVGLAKLLLEAACVLRDGSTLVTVQRALTGAVLGCDAEAAAEVKREGTLYLARLHSETMHYQQEDYQATKLSCSPVLQSFASTIVALNLAVSQHEAIQALRTLRTYLAEANGDKPLAHRGSSPWGCLVANKEELRRPLESLLLLRQFLTCLRAQTPLPGWVQDLAKAETFDHAEIHSFDDRDTVGGVRVVENCKKSVRRAGLAGDEWAYALGNLPMQDRHTVFRVQVQGPPGAWRGCIQVGAVVVDRTWSPEQRNALRSQEWLGSGVTWAMGSSRAGSKLTETESGEVVYTDMSSKFVPGNVVAMLLSNWAIHYYVAVDNTQPFTFVQQVPLPPEAVGAVVPLVRMLRPGCACTIIDSLPPPPGLPPQATPTAPPEFASVAMGPRAFPGRNTVSQGVMDLEGALDAQWPSTLDALLVEYAEQRAAELKKTSVAALPVADLFEAQPAAPLSSRPLPSSAPSSADAAAVLDRAPSQLPPAIRTHSGIVAGETGGVRVGEAMTHAARGVCISLAELSPQVLKGRFAILKVLNELIKAARPLVNLALYEHKQELGYLLAHSKGRIFPEMKKEALAASLQQHSDSNGLPGVAGEPKLNITREHRPSAPAAPDRGREKSVFAQAMSQLQKGGHSLIPVVERSGKLMSWTVTFHGEPATDYAGLYRESIRLMAAELQSTDPTGLRLFVPCPNHRTAQSTNQDRWVPNPAAKSERRLAMFRFLGRVMGACLRSNSPIDLDLPSMVWRPLVGEASTEADVTALDEAFGVDLEQCRACPSPEEWQALGKTWRVRSVTGKWMGLMHGGEGQLVAWEKREAFVEEMLRARLRENEPQINAIKAGFYAVVPPLVLPLLTWRELEVRVCGRPVVDVPRLEAITQYDSFPGGAKHVVAAMFWRVVKDFSERDKGALLAFASGRRRMPAPNSGEFLTLRLATELGEQHLPMAHTCLFQLDLPPYSSAATMREKLLYAITCCAGIESDAPVRARSTLYDSDSESEGGDGEGSDDEREGEREKEREREVETVAVRADGGRNWLQPPLDGGHTEMRLRMEFDDARGVLHTEPGRERVRDTPQAGEGSESDSETVASQHSAESTPDNIGYDNIGCSVS